MRVLCLVLVFALLSPVSALARKGAKPQMCGAKAALYLAEKRKNQPWPSGWAIDKLWVRRVGSVDAPATILDILLPDGRETAAVGQRLSYFFAVSDVEDVNGGVTWSPETSRTLPPFFRIVTKGDDQHFEEGVVYSFKGCEDPPSPKEALA